MAIDRADGRPSLRRCGENLAPFAILGDPIRTPPFATVANRCGIMPDLPRARPADRAPVIRRALVRSTLFSLFSAHPPPRPSERSPRPVPSAVLPARLRRRSQNALRPLALSLRSLALNLHGPTPLIALKAGPGFQAPKRPSADPSPAPGRPWLKTRFSIKASTGQPGRERASDDSDH